MRPNRRAATLLLLSLAGSAGGCQSCRSDPEPAATGAGAEADEGPKTADGRPALPRLEDHHPELVPLIQSKLSQLGDAHDPPVVHRGPDGAPKYTNRLVLERSQYLRDYTHQPVDWLPWGRDALRIAKYRSHPILLQIGAGSCHACRARARDFEDEELAAFINGWFVPVRVDLGERPDVARLYRRAAERLIGASGLPLTLLLTPHGDPLFAEVDLPARDEGDRKGLFTVLREAQARWASDRTAFRREAEEVSRALRSEALPPTRPAVPGPEVVRAGYEAIAATYDPDHGGFGDGDRTPSPPRLDFLLRYWRRTGDPRALDQVEGTLRAMANGAIHDHLGGGFHRAADRTWRRPIFEKTLPLNAQLAGVYLDAARALAESRGRDDARPRLRATTAFDAEVGLWSPADVVLRTLGFLERELQTPLHTYRSAVSADGRDAAGDRVEGLPYTWTAAEVEAAVGDPRAAAVATSLLGLDDGAGTAGRAAPRWAPGRTRLEQALDAGPLDVAGFGALLDTLLEARATARPPADVDEMEIVGWNALAISALARAAGTRKDRLLAATLTAAQVIGHGQGRFRRMSRGFFEGERLDAGFLEDHALLIAAMLDLHEATGALQWLAEARRYQAWLDDHFAEASRHGAYYATADYHDELAVRLRPHVDGQVPAGNGVVALNLLRLADLTGDAAYREAAERVLVAFADGLREAPARSPSLLAALERYHGTPTAVVVAYPEDSRWRGGPTERDALRALQQAIQAVYLPNTTLHVIVGEPSAERVAATPLVRGKVARGGEPTAWICRERRCGPPLTDPARVRAALTGLRRPPLAE